MIVYVVYGFLFLLAVFKDRAMLGCTLDVTKDCDNENGKVTKGTKSLSTDSTLVILEKILYASHANERIVVWRTSFIIIAISIFLSWFLLYQRIPTELELAGLTVVFFLFMYFSCGFMQYHLHRYIEKNVEDSVSILKNRLG